MNDHLDEIVAEKTADALVRTYGFALAEAAADIWRWGDGYGGYVRNIIEECFDALGLPSPPPAGPPAKRRKVLSSAIRKAVYENDEYRCRICDGWTDLTIDHVIPVVHGGTDDLSNLQTLCRKCNGKKGAKLDYQGR